jgi:2-polyprenyl-6-methoxyphenol hydroxylase-like FAD-dependent oxidoreductase
MVSLAQRHSCQFLPETDVVKPAKTVLISGASIAGPALAFWLKKHGFEPTLVERAPRPRPGGQAIDVRGKALEVMERMRLKKRAIAMRTQMRGMSIQDEFGREISRSEERTLSSGRFDSDDVELLRDDLSNLLLSAIADVESVYGESIERIAERDDGIIVTFRNGLERCFDLVIGADGLHSNVRHLAFGDEMPTLQPLGFGLAVFSIPNYLNLQGWQVSFRDDERKFGYLVYPARANTELRVTVGFGVQSAEEYRGDIEAQKTLVADKSAGRGREVQNFITRMWSSTDFYFGAAAQVLMDPWSVGRITLVGDAGYCPSPLSGQGTSMALVGAYVLADELAKAPENHTAAYASYEARMRPYVLLNQALALRDHSVPESETEAALTKAKNAIELEV